MVVAGKKSNADDEYSEYGRESDARPITGASNKSAWEAGIKSAEVAAELCKTDKQGRGAEPTLRVRSKHIIYPFFKCTIGQEDHMVRKLGRILKYWLHHNHFRYSLAG